MGHHLGEPIRVLVVDDHPVVRNGIRSLLAGFGDILVLGEAEDGASALGWLGRESFDVALVDIKLGSEDGLVLARQFMHRFADLRIIILTSYDDEGSLSEAARIGAHGYLLKTASPEILAEAIRAVCRGERRLSPVLADKALRQVQALVQEITRLRSGLSEDEITLLSLIADGMSVCDIAAKLNYSERTVKRKTQEILDKLDAVNRTQAVSEAYRRGLL